MTYNYYLEGVSGGVKINKYFEGYKTIKGLNTAIIKYQKNNRVVNLGCVLYTFSGNKDKKYDKDQYKILDRFNAKAYFEYWK